MEYFLAILRYSEKTPSNLQTLTRTSRPAARFAEAHREDRQEMERAITLFIIKLLLLINLLLHWVSKQARLSQWHKAD